MFIKRELSGKMLLNIMIIPKKMKSSLYSRYYAEACKEFRGKSTRLSAWAVGISAPKKHCSMSDSLAAPGLI